MLKNSYPPLSPLQNKILDYLTLLGPTPVPRSWITTLLARDKGFTPKQFPLGPTPESLAIDFLLDQQLILPHNQSESLLTLPETLIEYRLAHIQQNPALSATYWNAITLLAAERGKAMKPAEYNPILQAEALRLIPLSLQLHAANRPLAALELANRITVPLLRGDKQPQAITLLQHFINDQTLPLPNAPRNLTALMNLATLLQDQRQYAPARNFLLQAITMGEQLLGRTNRDLVSCYATLAEVQASLGDFPAAHIAIHQSLNICRQNFPENHFAFAHPYSSLGIVYATQQNIPKAIENYQRAISIAESHPGMGENRLAINYLGLAAIHLNARKYIAGRPPARKALDLKLQHLPPDHPKLETYYEILAYLLHLHPFKKDALEIIRLFQQILLIRSRRFSDNHPKIAPLHLMLANSFLRIRRIPEAKEHFQKYIDILSENPDIDLKQLTNIHLKFAKFLSDHDDSTLAPPHINLALTYAKKLFPPNSPDLAAKYLQAAGFLRDLKQTAKAKRLTKMAHAISQPKIEPAALPVNPENTST